MNLFTKPSIDDDAFPSSLIYSNVSPRWTQRKNEELGCAHGSQHFGGRRACWNSEIGTRKSDKQVNYSHKFAQTKQQVG
jgi:hypothetical protein